MDRSTKHTDARIAAQRLPALAASLALLVKDTATATLAIYGTVRPDPGDPPGDDALVTLSLADSAGAVNEELFQIQIAVPLEGQILGAAETTGTDALWARITDGAEDWWGDCSVSDEAGAGEIKLQTTLLYNGAFCRLTSAVFQG